MSPPLHRAYVQEGQLGGWFVMTPAGEVDGPFICREDALHGAFDAVAGLYPWVVAVLDVEGRRLEKHSS